MTIRSLLLAILLSGFSPLSAQVLTARSKVFKGTPKIVRTRVFTAADKFGEVSQGVPVPSKENAVHKFDQEGNLIEESQYDVNGILTRRILFEYDGAGNLTQENLFFGIPLNSDQLNPPSLRAQPLSQSWHYLYVAGEDGKTRYSLCRYVPDNRRTAGPRAVVTDSTVYSYYATGSVRTKTTYVNSNLRSKFLNILEASVSVYDKSGLIRLSFDGTEVYGNHRTIPGSSSSNVSREQFEKLVMTRDVAQRKIIRFDTTYRQSYFYEKDLLFKIVAFSSYEPRVAVVTTLEYDGAGQIIKQRQAGGTNESFISFTYEYDRNGNWISKVRYENGVPTYYYTRNIEYY